MKDTRFIKKDAYLINSTDLTAVMRELYDDSSLTIDPDYPVLYMDSEKRGRGYDEEDLLEKLNKHYGTKFVACLRWLDLEMIYLISKEGVKIK